MKKLNFFRSVCTWGYWIATIGKVFCAIVAVFALLGVLLLSTMPKDFVRVEMLAETKIDLNLRALLGENWDRDKETIAGAVSPDAVITENGICVSEKEELPPVENRAVALVLIPAFVEYSLLFALLKFAARAFGEVKDSPVPFTPGAARELRTVGSLTMAMGAVPGLASWLIGLLTNASLDSTDMDLGLIFIGFLLWGLAELFEYGVALQDRPTPAEDAPPHDPHAF